MPHTTLQLPEEYEKENLELVEAGCSNLVHHIKNVVRSTVLSSFVASCSGALTKLITCCTLRALLCMQLKFGVKPVVCVNRFSLDTDAEVELVSTIL